MGRAVSRGCVVFCVAHVVAAGAQAAEPIDAAQALTEIAQRLSTVRTLETRLSQEKRLAAFGKPQRAEGTLLFARPNRLRLDLEGKGGSIIIVDGDALTLHYKALKRTDRLSLSADPRARAVAEHLFLLVDADPVRLATVYDLELRNAAPLTIRLVPRADALRRLIASIDATFGADGFAQTILVREPGGDETEWRFAPPKVNGPLADDRFRPPG